MSRLPLACLVLLGLAASGYTEARTFNVTSDADAPDLVPGDFQCNIYPPELPPACTLRAAIMEANALAVTDEIRIPPNMHIVLASHLPGTVHDLEIGTQGLVFDVSALPVIDGDGQFRQFLVAAGAHLTLRDLRLVNGNNAGMVVTDGGGALAMAPNSEVTVERVQFTGNRAFNGGGALTVKGQATVIDSDFNMNEATSSDGGAIEVQSGGSLILQRSSVRRSRSSTATAEAIFVGDGASLVVENSLIDGADGQPGNTERGGIRAISPDLLRLRNTTLVNFTRRGLHIDGAGAGTLAVENSILAGADQGDCLIENISPAMVTFSYNLVEDASCTGYGGFGALTNIAGDPTLGPQQVDVTAFRRYRTPQFASPAIDAGNPSVASANACLSADLRNTPRPLDGDADGVARCDIGAIETSALTAQTFVVNVDTLDLVDTNPGDGICGTILGNGQCTLRAAVMEANARPGPDTIVFDVAGTDGNITLTDPANGDLDITEALTIEGGNTQSGYPSTWINQEAAGERVFEVLTSQPVVFRNLRFVFQGAVVPTSGGGIRVNGGGPVAIEHSQIVGRRSSAAGGAVSVVNGSLNMFDVDLYDNRADDRGAALFVGANGEATVRSSSFRHNIITDPATVVRDAIHVEQGGTLLMENSTVAFNDGGIYAPGAATIEITQSTIAFNEDRGLHVVFNGGEDSLTLRSSIFAGNGITDCFLFNVGAADFLSQSYNLDESGSHCGPGGTNIVAFPALIVPPVSDDGVTRPLPRGEGRVARYLEPLHEAAFDSPVLDVVPAGGPDCLAEDIVGTTRGQQLPDQPDSPGTCDIGAFEVVAAQRPDAIFADGFED